jgi:hypothetical protein
MCDLVVNNVTAGFERVTDVTTLRIHYRQVTLLLFPRYYETLTTEVIDVATYAEVRMRYTQGGI